MTSRLTYKQEIHIPFHLADPAGILFFGHVFTLAHQVFEGFLISGLHLDWHHWFQNPDWIVPIRQATADYYHPILAGDTCSMVLQIIQVKSSSFTTGIQFIQKKTVCCNVQKTHVFCNRLTHEKQKIPSAILSLINFSE